MANLLDQDVRKNIIRDICSEENKHRKTESFKRLDIYKKNQKKYILDRILKDLSPDTVANMRTFTSINFTQKIINSKASIYKTKPERSFANAQEREKALLEELYKYAQVDVKLKKANRMFKLEDQCAVQIIPKGGCIHLRVLAPHHYDVVPKIDMPEEAECYVISAYDKQLAWNDTANAEALDAQSRNSASTNIKDNVNQSIADQEDYYDQLNYFVFWSDQFHFACDKDGNFLDQNNKPYVGPIPPQELINPIGVMPFIDLAPERDFEYWVRTGSNVTDLQLDLGAQISDTCDVNFRQGYSQAILSATEAPKSMQIGPHTLLFLKKNPKGEPGTQPEFAFATPSPDLGSSIKLTEMLLAMGLTSEGLDASTISTSSSSDQKSYTSGYERMLGQLEEFSASADDIELFRYVEAKVLDLIRLWSNALQNVVGPLELKKELKGGQISDSVEVNVKFKTPEMVQSQAEKEDSNIKLMESGLKSRKMAVMDIYGVDENKAEEIIDEIDEEAVTAAEESQTDLGQTESQDQVSDQEIENNNDGGDEIDGENLDA